MRLLSAAILLVLFLAGCSRSHVEVRNVGNSPIETIEIRIAGNELRIDRLNPGDSRRIAYSTKSEETIAISFLIQETQSRCSAGFYVTPPFEDEFTVNISSDGKCAISHTPVSN